MPPRISRAMPKDSEILVPLTTLAVDTAQIDITLDFTKFTENILEAMFRSNNAVTFQNMYSRINGNAVAGNYINEVTRIQGTVQSVRASDPTSVQFQMADMLGNSAPAGEFMKLIIRIWTFDSNIGFLHFLTTFSGQFGNLANNNDSGHSTGHYKGAAPFTQLNLIPSAGSFLTGCKYKLWGRMRQAL